MTSVNKATIIALPWKADCASNSTVVESVLFDIIGDKGVRRGTGFTGQKHKLKYLHAYKTISGQIVSREYRPISSRSLYWNVLTKDATDRINAMLIGMDFSESEPWNRAAQVITVGCYEGYCERQRESRGWAFISTKQRAGYRYTDWYGKPAARESGIGEENSGMVWVNYLQWYTRLPAKEDSATSTWSDFSFEVRHLRFSGLKSIDITSHQIRSHRRWYIASLYRPSLCFLNMKQWAPCKRWDYPSNSRSVTCGADRKPFCWHSLEYEDKLRRSADIQ